MKIVKKVQLKIVIFTAVKNRCKLHGRVFAMGTARDRDFLCYPVLTSTHNLCLEQKLKKTM